MIRITYSSVGGRGGGEAGERMEPPQESRRESCGESCGESCKIPINGRIQEVDVKGKRSMKRRLNGDRSVGSVGGRRPPGGVSGPRSIRRWRRRRPCSQHPATRLEAMSPGRAIPQDLFHDPAGSFSGSRRIFFRIDPAAETLPAAARRSSTINQI